MVEYQMRCRLFVHAGNKWPIEKIIERIEDLHSMANIHDVYMGDVVVDRSDWTDIPDAQIRRDLDEAYERIRDLEGRVRTAWQAIHRIDPRMQVPALRELNKDLRVGERGNVE